MLHEKRMCYCCERRPAKYYLTGKHKTVLEPVCEECFPRLVKDFLVKELQRSIDFTPNAPLRDVFDIKLHIIDDDDELSNVICPRKFDLLRILGIADSESI